MFENIRMRLYEFIQILYIDRLIYTMFRALFDYFSLGYDENGFLLSVKDPKYTVQTLVPTFCVTASLTSPYQDRSPLSARSLTSSESATPE